MLEIGKPIPKKTRKALSLFLKTADYHILGEKEDTPLKSSTIRDLMRGVEITNTDRMETAVKLIQYGLDKACEVIKNLDEAKETIRIEISNLKEVAA